MRLENKIAIVTGAASGFGEGIARRYATEGAKVLVADIDAAGAERVAGEIAAEGGQAASLQVDVSDDAQVAAMVATAVTRFGDLDLVVNNAGVPQRNMPMLDVDEATFDRIYAVNVKSIYLTARHAVPVFRARGGGAFVNIGSTAGIRPRPGLTWYNGSKAAVNVLTKSIAAELAPDGIRANAIAPVAGDTPMLAELMGGQVTNEGYAKFVASVPLGRLSQPTDIANAALFLASDEATLITGVCLEVDGGRCI